MARHATRLARAISLVPALLLLSTCAESPTEPIGAVDPITELPRALTDGEQEVLTASNGFAWKLLQETASRSPGGSVLVSPLSASIALGMAANGAGGATFEQMTDVLGLGSLSIEAINASYRGLLDLLPGLDPSLALQITNSVWYRDGFAVEGPFLDATRSFFDAEVASLDFSSPSAAPTINRWVDENTNGRIRDIVQAPIDEDMMMFLINAVYFKGPWTFAFEPEKTQSVPFHLEGGEAESVELMGLEGDLPYTSDADVQMVELPYAGRAFAMNVLLPTSTETGVDALLASLDEARWHELVSGLSEHAVTVMLPRFRFEFEARLNDALVALGMVDAFDEIQADLHRISRRRLHISEARQKTFIEVTEEGTEAAAATLVGFRLSSGGDRPRLTFRADRPFVFVIRERLSGAVLFTGVYRGSSV